MHVYTCLHIGREAGDSDTASSMSCSMPRALSQPTSSSSHYNSSDSSVGGDRGATRRGSTARGGGSLAIQTGASISKHQGGGGGGGRKHANKTDKCAASQAPTIPSLVTSIVSFCWSAAHVALFSLYLCVCMCMCVYMRVTSVGGCGVCKERQAAARRVATAGQVPVSPSAYCTGATDCQVCVHHD